MLYTYVHTYVSLCLCICSVCICIYVYVGTSRTHALTHEPLECLFKPEVILKVYKQYVEWHDLTNSNLG